MKVWLIRHGESETNNAGLWTGWLDVALTEKGRQDASRVSKTLSGVKFDKIYSSDLRRARTTAEIALPGSKYEATPLIREINVGSVAGKPFDSVVNSEGVYMNKDGYTAFGGESYKEFTERAVAFMKMLEAENCENIAAFSHGGFVRKFLELVIGAAIPRKNIYSGNCVVAIFEYCNQTWRLHSWINLIDERDLAEKNCD